MIPNVKSLHLPGEVIVAVDFEGNPIWLDARGYAKTSLLNDIDTETLIAELPTWEYKRLPLSVWQFIGNAILRWDEYEGVPYVDSVDWEGSFEQLWNLGEDCV